MDILITKRLTLRPPLDVDIDGVFQGLSNEKVARNLSSVPFPYRQLHAAEWVRKCQAAQNRTCLEKGNLSVATYTVHREQMIGVVAVTPEKEGVRLGYWFAEPFWGKGYATEAARAVISHYFKSTGVPEITSYAFIDNEESLRVMQKLGFERVGTVFHSNLTRGEDVEAVQTKLKRERFENLFGSLDSSAVA